MRFFLIGFMGCGKSTIGKKLARKLEYNFIDLDRYIEATLFKTIPEIFEEKGEDEFRKLEAKYLNEVSQFENVVISTGGGTPCFFNNIEIMKTAGKVIYLQLTPKTLLSRLQNAKSHNRPLLDKLNNTELSGFIEEKVLERKVFYEKAHLTISALSIDINELIEQIKV